VDYLQRAVKLLIGHGGGWGGCEAWSIFRRAMLMVGVACVEGCGRALIGDLQRDIYHQLSLVQLEQHYNRTREFVIRRCVV